VGLVVSESEAGRRRAEGLTHAQPSQQGLQGTAQTLHKLCCAAGLDLPASGVGISLLSETGVPAMAAVSDLVSERVEELQFTLGEGPCLDAFTSRRPVLTEDLDIGGATRWPAYSSAAGEHGVRAVFAFPLTVGTSCLGALDVYRAHPGPLSPQALAAALAFADYATATLLTGQQQAGPDRPPPGLDDVLASRFEVHQAQGMLTVQLGVGLDEALIRLRAHAFAQGRSLGLVARDVLAGTLVIERDEP
jgi:hypothetical protein